MQKFSLMAGSIFGMLSVMIGAFGAHALGPMLKNSNRVETFETAVKYQFYHALALLVIGVLCYHLPHPALRWASWAFVGGILVFSGSLYILCLTGITWLGAITPLGGTLFIVGWACLLYAISKAL